MSVSRTSQTQQQQEYDLKSMGYEIHNVKKTFTPIGKLIAVKIFPVGKSPGGIELPESIQQSGGGIETPRAQVIAVGPEVDQIKEGDIILLGHLQGNRPQGVIHKGQVVGVVHQDSVWGIEIPDQNNSDNFHYPSD